MKKNQFIFLFFLFQALVWKYSYAQNPYSGLKTDSLKTVSSFDTANTNKLAASAVNLDSAKTADIRSHSAKKASIYSAVLPGLGQAYNKKYWKIPIVYAGFGVMTYLFSINNSRFNKYKTALIVRNDGDESTVDEFATQYPNQQALIEFKDYYRRNRDFSAIGFALFYVLNIVDANVDANLYYFDVSDDLTFQWSPAFIPAATFASGLSFKLKF
jgi:hypothetical protein